MKQLSIYNTRDNWKLFQIVLALKEFIHTSTITKLKREEGSDESTM